MSALTKLSILLLLVAGGSCLFIVMAVIAPTQKIEKKSTYYQAIALYAHTRDIHQSQKLGKQIENIVIKRMDCYRFSPFERGSRCLGPYSSDLVALGRQQLQSAPDLGLFLEQIQLCPLVHAMCMGDIQEARNCISMEARCLDSVYDEYWRGSPFSQLY